MANALARLLTPEFGNRCREVARRAVGKDGLEIAAGWVEELGAMSNR
jgi:hypothetical protein